MLVTMELTTRRLAVLTMAILPATSACDAEDMPAGASSSTDSAADTSSAPEECDGLVGDFEVGGLSAEGGELGTEVDCNLLRVQVSEVVEGTKFDTALTLDCAGDESPTVVRFFSNADTGFAPVVPQEVLLSGSSSREGFVNGRFPESWLRLRSGSDGTLLFAMFSVYGEELLGPSGESDWLPDVRMRRGAMICSVPPGCDTEATQHHFADLTLNGQNMSLASGERIVDGGLVVGLGFFGELQGCDGIPGAPNLSGVVYRTSEGNQAATETGVDLR